MKKKVLITGARGFIGSNMLNFYLEQGWQVYAIDNTKFNENHENLNGYCVDLENEVLIDLYSQINPDVFIHCAGNANVSISVENPELDFKRNVGILYRVLTDIKESKISPIFIYLSSAAVYGNPKILPINETTQLNPISPYGLHKKICEEICLYYAENYNLDLKILRIFSTYGNGLKKQIIWDLSQKLAIGDKVELFGTGKESRDFIHIKDLISALNIIVESKTKEVVFNIANGEETTISQIAQVFISNLEKEKDSVTFNGIVRSGDPLNWRADIEKIKSLKYKKTISIEDGISDYIEWLKKV